MAELNGTSLKSLTTLKAYYKFSSGADTTDDSGNSHTLTDISAPGTDTGVYGDCATFTTDDGFSAVNHADLRPTGNYTVAAWVKIPNGGAYNCLFQSFYLANVVTPTFQGVQIQKDNNNKIYAFHGYGASPDDGKYYDLHGSVSLGNNTWTHVAVTYDGSNIKIYINGELDGTKAATNGCTYSASNAVRIGCSYNIDTNGDFWEGSIDDLALWNGTALTADQVAVLYSSTVQTITVYPSEDASVGEENPGEGVTWAAIEAGGGDFVQESSSYYAAHFQCTNTNPNFLYLIKSIFVFNTSALTEAATINSATFSVYGNDKDDEGSWTPTINIYNATPASDTEIVATDFTQVGTTTYCDTAITYADFSTTGYNSFVLNSAGLAAISKTGNTKIGIREAKYDAGASTPTWSDGATAAFKIYFTDNATNKPKLIIDYEPGPSTSNFFAFF